jgi:WD40 repeat protein
MHLSKTNVTEDATVLTFKYSGDSTAISSYGTRIASITSGRVVAIWQTNGPSLNHDTASHHDTVESIAFSGDGQVIASGSADTTAKLWDPTTGRCFHTFKHPDPVTLVMFSPDSTLLSSVTAGNHAIRIWNTRTHKLISTLKNPSRVASYFDHSLGFSSNCSRLVSLERGYTRQDGQSARLELWEVATEKHLASMELDGYVEKVTFGVDGTSVVLDKISSTMRYEISSIQSSSNDDKDGHSSPPMQFVRMDDKQQFVSSHLPCYRQESGWILDEQERRVLWVPPDLRNGSDAYGKKIVLGSDSGRVAILDFSDVRR